MFEELSIIFAGFLTLCIFSFLYKDNPFYRFAEHLYVGVSAGYMMSRGMADVMMKKLITPLFYTPQGTAIDYSLIIPILLGLFMILKLVPKVDWLSRWAIALVVGGTIGLSMTTRFKSDVILQVRQTVEATQSKEVSFDKIIEKKNQIDLKSEFSHMQAVNKLSEYLVLEAMALRNLVKSDGGIEQVSETSLKSLQQGWARASEAKSKLDKHLSALQSSLSNSAKLYSLAIQSVKASQVSLKSDITKFFKTESTNMTFNDLDMKAFELGKSLSKIKKLELDLQSSEIIVSLRTKSLLENISLCLGHLYPPTPNMGTLKNGVEGVQALQKNLQLLMTSFESLQGDLSSYKAASKYFKSKDKDSLLAIDVKSFFNGKAASMQETFIKTDLTTHFASTAYDLFKNLLIAFGVLTILVYFFFSTEHKGAVGVGAKVGIYFLMITFGASFGYTIMARISLLIGRMDFLIDNVSGAFRSLGL